MGGLQLPVEYAVVLRLADAGATDDLIAAGAGVETTSVAGRLRIARSKLAEMMGAASAEDACAAQRGDPVGVEAELGEHLVGVLAEQRCPPCEAGGRPRELCRVPGMADAS